MQDSLPQAPLDTQEALVSDYIALLKPRVMSLAIFTTACSMIAAPGKLDPCLVSVAVLCTALGAGGAGALNMWYDRDIDALMKRTQKRPIVLGRVDPDEAFMLGVFLSTLSVLTMGVFINYMSAVVLLASILFYILVYTAWLKRTTTQNIVIGGAAGAFPAALGWTCATGRLDVHAFTLFAIVFLWTPAHFWALAIHKCDDYKAANIPMMPTVQGTRYTIKLIIFYGALTTLATIMPYFTGLSGKSYLVCAILLNLVWIYRQLDLVRTQCGKVAMKLFYFSMVYLFGIFASLALDALAFN